MITAFVILSPVIVHGQTVTNPRTAIITVGPDHALITRYELGWFLGAAVDPVQVADLGTGPAVAGELSKAIPSYPIGVTYTAKVRGYVNTIVSDWSPTSNPFYRTPAAAPALVIR
jgi:hypothetical protein